MRKAEEKAQVSYAVGMVIGSDLSGSGLEIDYAAFAEGLRAVLENASPQFSENEALEIAQNALQKARIAAENRYLAENAARPEVQTTPSGLQYEVLAEGSGPKPSASDVVIVNYEGSLADGTIFDRSYEEGGAQIPLAQVIPGWTEGITLMNTGSKYRLYIPSSLAYGANGAGPAIPPYSTLVFTVELLGIAEPESDEEAENAE
jgi:FKBP-type peptidyl-prolyl cis-trans isomerase